MSGFWPIFFLAVVLKIPVLGALWLVWWASREPTEEGSTEDAGGGSKRFGPKPDGPRRPRRGPHGGGVAKPLPDCPPGGRTRVVKPAALPAFSRGESREDTGGSRPRSCDA